jgi:hypothetical protein
VRRVAKGPAELTREMRGREMRGPGERRHVEPLAVAGVDQVLRAEEVADWMDRRHLLLPGLTQHVEDHDRENDEEPDDRPYRQTPSRLGQALLLADGLDLFASGEHFARKLGRRRPDGGVLGTASTNGLEQPLGFALLALVTLLRDMEREALDRAQCPAVAGEASRFERVPEPDERLVGCATPEGPPSLLELIAHDPSIPRPAGPATIGAMVDPAERERTLGRIREICLGLPETSERLSHGAPTFFVRDKRAFLMVLTDHHGDGRFAIWCAAPDGIQRMLVEADPERFFVPPYVGHRGWLGVRLDRGLDWDEIAGIAEDAYAKVAPARLVEAARRG